MSSESSSTSSDLLVPLPWDSEHFGFPVARLDVAGDVTAAAALLAEARRRGVALVYWQVEPAAVVPSSLLVNFAGRLVDRKATFSAELSAVERRVPGEDSTWSVREYPPGKATNALKELAVSAGEFSRFARDPFFPRESYIALYQTWIERCTRRELADIVLEASVAAGVPLGVATVSEARGLAKIGLIAVAAQARGKGLGRLLMRAAHRWMLGRGAARANVVTQLDNTPACRLYERLGYQLIEVNAFYHFWPLCPAPDAQSTAASG
jgi:dTDP-4-amino-4,6-dideoxy-D-galactose acyltransferase